MGTILASAILTKVKTLLQDPGNVRWSDAELLGWLNDGQREIAIKRPDVCSKVASMPLVAGTKQTIPSDGVALLKVIRNMGGGSTPGAAIRMVPMDLLDANMPNWHAATASATTQHYTADSRMPKVFYVYPPANGSTYVETLYSTTPADIASTSSPITLDDIYVGPLVDYTCFRAYTKDQDLAGSADRAAGHRSLFDAALDAKSTADSVVRTQYKA